MTIIGFFVMSFICHCRGSNPSVMLLSHFEVEPLLAVCDLHSEGVLYNYYHWSMFDVFPLMLAGCTCIGQVTTKRVFGCVFVMAYLLCT